jgi:HJR/Mrr/RecB family endonuclease
MGLFVISAALFLSLLGWAMDYWPVALVVLGVTGYGLHCARKGVAAGVEEMWLRASPVIERRAATPFGRDPQTVVGDARESEEALRREQERGRFAEVAKYSAMGPSPIFGRPGMDRLFGLIDDAVAAWQGKPAVAAAPAHPVGYEVYCKAVLEADGWVARTTKAAGDQGGGLVAEIDGMRFVAQCRRKRRAVGDLAVQEAIAARAVEKADHAAVVSVSGYTLAAYALAASAGVLLLHHAELPGLADRLTAAALPAVK